MAWNQYNYYHGKMLRVPVDFANLFLFIKPIQKEINRRSRYSIQVLHMPFQFPENATAP